VRSAKWEGAVECPHCGSKRLTKKLSVFAAQGAGPASDSSPAPPPCGAPAAAVALALASSLMAGRLDLEIGEIVPGVIVQGQQVQPASVEGDGPDLRLIPDMPTPGGHGKFAFTGRLVVHGEPDCFWFVAVESRDFIFSLLDHVHRVIAPFTIVCPTDIS